MDKRACFFAIMFGMSCSLYAEDITFADDAVKALCVQNWDTDVNGELSMEEAAAVESLGSVFRANKDIVSFEELQYFTGLTAIDDYAFYQSSIQSVAFPPTVESIGQYAFSQSNIGAELRVPGTVKNLGKYAFNSCKQLTKVVLEEGVETIGWHTFSGPIATLMLPTTITFISSMAIDPYVNAEGSSGLFTPEGDLYVYSRAEVPAVINEFAFYYLFWECHIVVPYGTIPAYKAELGWSYFGEYLEFGDVNMDGTVNPYDVKLLRQYLDEGESDEMNEYMADVNGDGVIDELDYEELDSHFYAEDGTPTMIAETETKEQSVPEGVYTIDGRKVLDDASQIQSLRPGIYISQGRKFVVR